MPAILLSLLAKFLPYIIGIVAVVGVYFGIKRKGANEMKEKMVKAQEKAVAKQQEKVQEAVSQDGSVDQKVMKQVDAIRKTETNPPDTYKPGDIFKF